MVARVSYNADLVGWRKQASPFASPMRVGGIERTLGESAMAEQQGNKLRGVDWAEVFPWLILGRTFRIAIQLRHLALSAAGFVLMLSGWALLGWVFPGGEEVGKPESSTEQESWSGECPWVAAHKMIPDSPVWFSPPVSAWEGATVERRLPPSSMAEGPKLAPAASSGWRGALWDPFWGTWEQLSRPFRSMFVTGMTVTGTVYLLLRGLWAVAVWAFFGAAVARAAAYELATCERLGLGALMKYARSAWRTYFGSIGIPLLGILPVGILMFLPGLLLLSQYTVWLSGLVLWPLALLGGFILAVLTLGLLFGWPIIWGSLAADKPDSFDAIGRGYQFTFQRPLNYFFYAVVAAVLGGAGLVRGVEFRRHDRQHDVVGGQLARYGGSDPRDRDRPGQWLAGRRIDAGPLLDRLSEAARRRLSVQLLLGLFDGDLPSPPPRCRRQGNGRGLHRGRTVRAAASHPYRHGRRSGDGGERPRRMRFDRCCGMT